MALNNNKLFLVCETCPYPTLISEFSGDEVFVAVFPKSEPYYLPFEEARDFVIALNLNSFQEWTKYSNNELDGYDTILEAIPTNPAKVYKNQGWINFANWLGLDVRKAHEMKLIDVQIKYIKKCARKQNVAKLLEVFLSNKDLVQKKVIKCIFNLLNMDGLLQLIDLLDDSDKVIFINIALENNSLEIFNALSRISCKIQKTDSSNKLKEQILKSKGYSEEEIFEIMREFNKEDFYNTFLIVSVKRESIVKVFQNYQEEISDSLLLKIVSENTSDRIFILDQSIQFGKLDLASKIISIGIQLDQYYLEHCESVEALETIITLFPSHWKTFDASFIFYYMEENIDEWRYDINSLQALFQPLKRHKIQIEFNDAKNTQIGFSNLISNNALELFQLLFEITLP